MVLVMRSPIIGPAGFLIRGPWDWPARYRTRFYRDRLFVRARVPTRTVHLTSLASHKTLLARDPVDSRRKNRALHRGTGIVQYR